MASALGTTQTVVVCVSASASGSGGVQGPCPSGQVTSLVSAYLIAPSEALHFDLMAEPFDASVAGAYFGFAFASTVFVWLFSLGAGVVIKMVKTA